MWKGTRPWTFLLLLVFLPRATIQKPKKSAASLSSLTGLTSGCRVCVYYRWECSLLFLLIACFFKVLVENLACTLQQITTLSFARNPSPHLISPSNNFSIILSLYTARHARLSFPLSLVNNPLSTQGQERAHTREKTGVEVNAHHTQVSSLVAVRPFVFSHLRSPAPLHSLLRNHYCYSYLDNNNYGRTRWDDIISHTTTNGVLYAAGPQLLSKHFASFSRFSIIEGKCKAGEKGG